MSLFRLQGIPKIFQSWVTAPGSNALDSFAQRAERLLNDHEDDFLDVTGFTDVHDLLRGVSAADDLAVRLLAPAAVAQYIEAETDAALSEILESDSVAFLDGSVQEHLQQAFGKSHPVMNDAIGRMPILAAAYRMYETWEALEKRPLFSMESAVLCSGGKFDSAMMFLMQQGLRYSWNRSPEENPDVPHFIGLQTREKSDVQAILYTAGVHKKGLPLYQFKEPWRTTAFPVHVAAELRAKIQLQFLTPPADRIHITYSEEALSQTAADAMLCYSTKSFAENTQDIDTWVATMLDEIGRDDIATNFIAGYTGSSSIFYQKQLPELDRYGIEGLHLGFGVNDLKRGLALALIMTGHEVNAKTDVLALFEKVGERTEFGSATIYTIKNLKLTLPLVISVYTDPDIRKAQVIFAQYKNIYSGILGQEMFQWAFEKLRANKFEFTQSMISEAKQFYEERMKAAEAEILANLVKVEGLPADKDLILELSLIDARTSWKMKDGGMEIFFQLIQAYFRPHDDVEPKQKKTLVRLAEVKWINEIVRVWPTRGPMLGASLGAGTEGTRSLLTKDPYALVDPDETFEGKNTALMLRRRLNERMTLLSETAQRFIERVQHIRQPTIFPEQSRQSLSDLVHFLENWTHGTRPGRDELRAFLLRDPTEEELRDDSLRRAELKADDYLRALEAAHHHLSHAMKLIGKESRGQDQLVEKGQEYLRKIVVFLQGLISRGQRSNGKVAFTPNEVQRLIHQLKLLIMEGDAVYMAEPPDDVMTILDKRIQGIFKFYFQRNMSGEAYPETFAPEELFSEVSRQALADLVHFLETRAHGTLPRRQDLRAFLGREPTDEEMADHFRWRSTLTVEDFTQSVKALMAHLKGTNDFIAKQSEARPWLFQQSVELIGQIESGLQILVDAAEESHSTKALAPIEIQKLIHALKLIIMEGDALYMGESIDNIIPIVAERMKFMIIYLEQRSQQGSVPRTRPYPPSEIPPPDSSTSRVA